MHPSALLFYGSDFFILFFLFLFYFFIFILFFFCFNLSQSTTKPTKWHVRPAKTQISLGFRPVWSESLLCAQWVADDPSFLHADSEDSDQTGRMPRLIWVFARRTCHFIGFVVRWLFLFYCIYVFMYYYIRVFKQIHAFHHRNVKKRTFVHVRPVKLQISLYNRAVWSESSLSEIWTVKGAKFFHADNEDYDQAGWMRRLVRVFVWRTCQKVRFRTLGLILRHIAFRKAVKSRLEKIMVVIDKDVTLRITSPPPPPTPSPHPLITDQPPHSISSIRVFVIRLTLSILGKKNQQRTFWIIFLMLPRKRALACHANCLRRQFAWNAKACFLGKVGNYREFVLCWFSP